MRLPRAIQPRLLDLNWALSSFSGAILKHTRIINKGARGGVGCSIHRQPIAEERRKAGSLILLGSIFNPKTVFVVSTKSGSRILTGRSPDNRFMATRFGLNVSDFQDLPRDHLKLIKMKSRVASLHGMKWILLLLPSCRSSSTS